jgi:hypothetical protein
MADRRAPIERLVDLAVAVPTCTVVAAARAVPVAARVGTFGTARLVGRISDAVHERRHGDLPGADMHGVEPVPVVPPVIVDETAAAVSVDELPIEGYDDLAARQVVDRLEALDDAELFRIEGYERAHRNRSTVLGKISMLRA